MVAKLQSSRKTLVTDARAALAASAGWNSRLAARRIARYVEARLDPGGLSLSQFELMAVIASATNDTLGALAKELGIDQSTLSRNLQALEKQELVEIVIAEKDLRRRAVWLTERGARALEKTLPLWRAANAELSRAFDVGLAARLARATERLRND